MANHSSEHAIETTELAREFKKGPRAVDGIDLAVEGGEIYGFLGPNGAGKSTTVLMLTTLLPPTAGTARVAGFGVVRDGAKERARIGGARPAAHRTGAPSPAGDTAGVATRRPSCARGRAARSRRAPRRRRPQGA